MPIDKDGNPYSIYLETWALEKPEARASWSKIKNMPDEDIYADIVTRFYEGKKMNRLEIEWMLDMTKEKAL